MKTDIYFPSTLPNMTSWSYAPYDRRVKSDLQVGPEQFRRREAAFRATAPVTWLFNRPQMLTFVNWLRDDLELTGKWFQLNAPFAGDTPWSYLVVRFTQPPTWTAIGNNQWTISANLEIFAYGTAPDNPEPPDEDVIWLDTFTGGSGDSLIGHINDIPLYDSAWEDAATGSVLVMDGLGNAIQDPLSEDRSGAKSVLYNVTGGASNISLQYPFSFKFVVTPGAHFAGTASPFGTESTLFQVRQTAFDTDYINAYFVPEDDSDPAQFYVDINGTTRTYDLLNAKNTVRVKIESDGYTVTINDVVMAKAGVAISNQFQWFYATIGLDSESPATSTVKISSVSLMGVEVLTLYVLDTFTSLVDAILEDHVGEVGADWSTTRIVPLSSIGGRTPNASFRDAFRIDSSYGGGAVLIDDDTPGVGFYIAASGTIPSGNGDFFMEMEFDYGPGGGGGYKDIFFYALDSDGTVLFYFGYLENSGVRYQIFTRDWVNTGAYSPGDENAYFNWQGRKILRIEVTHERQALKVFLNGTTAEGSNVGESYPGSDDQYLNYVPSGTGSPAQLGLLAGFDCGRLHRIAAGPLSALTYVRLNVLNDDVPSMQFGTDYLSDFPSVQAYYNADSSPYLDDDGNAGWTGGGDYVGIDRVASTGPLSTGEAALPVDRESSVWQMTADLTSNQYVSEIYIQVRPSSMKVEFGISFNLAAGPFDQNVAHLGDDITAVYWISDGRLVVAGVTTTGMPTYDEGDFIAIIIDVAGSLIMFYKNGVRVGALDTVLTGDPSASIIFASAQ